MEREISDLGPDGLWFLQKALAEREIVEAHDLERVKIAARCLDEIRADERRVELEGRYTRARFNRLIPHAAIKVIQENRAIFLRVVREMGLDQVVDDREQGRLF
jgi:hypothetical protein